MRTGTRTPVRSDSVHGCNFACIWSSGHVLVGRCACARAEGLAPRCSPSRLIVTRLSPPCALCRARLHFVLALSLTRARGQCVSHLHSPPRKHCSTKVAHPYATPTDETANQTTYRHEVLPTCYSRNVKRALRTQLVLPPTVHSIGRGSVARNPRFLRVHAHTSMHTHCHRTGPAPLNGSRDASCGRMSSSA